MSGDRTRGIGDTLKVESGLKQGAKYLLMAEVRAQAGGVGSHKRGDTVSKEGS